MVNLGTEKVIRCLNCWKLYPNSKSILDHWINGRCLFYCSICGESFHENIKSIRDHFPDVHGIKYRIPERPLNVGVTDLNKPSPSQPSIQHFGVNDVKHRVNSKQITEKLTKKNQTVQNTALSKLTCPVCNMKFASRHGRNSHMRLHKSNGKESKPVAGPSRTNSPASSVGSVGSLKSVNINQKLPVLATKLPQIVAKHKSAVTPSVVVARPKPKSVAARKPAASVKVPASKSTTIKSPALTVKVKNERVEDTSLTDISEIIANDIHSGQYVDTSEYLMPQTTDGDIPRLQVKSLYELQQPTHDPLKHVVPMETQMTVCDPYYGQANCYQPMMTDPGYMNHPNSMQPPPLAPLQSSQPTYQMAQTQPLQNTQYYNPVFVVQQPTNVVPDPSVYQHQQSQQAYGCPNDYGPYYT